MLASEPMKFARAAIVVGAMSLGAVPLVTVSTPASASTSFALALNELVKDSRLATVAVPVESKAVWENGRICTYSRLTIRRTIAGSLEGKTEVWVRTLGGIVGDIGQAVDGEAVFVPGKPSLVFLQDGPIGTYSVTGRSQGQFPVMTEAGQAPYLIRNANVGTLVAPPIGRDREAGGGTLPQGLTARQPFAVDILHGRTIDDAARDISALWVKLHGR